MIDENHLNRILQSVQNESIKMAVSMYYNLLDQELSKAAIDSANGWSFKPINIEPVTQIINKDILIGAEILVGFLSQFHSTYVSAFQITVVNRIAQSDMCSFFGEIRQNIDVDLVTDGELPAFKLMQRKVYAELKELLETIWAHKVIRTMMMSMNKDARPQKETPVKQSPANMVSTTMQFQPSQASMADAAMINAMPSPDDKPSMLRLDESGDINIPLIGNRMQSTASRQSTQKPQPQQQNKNEQPKEDPEDDLNDDIDIKLASRIPDVDDDMFSFTPEMMKKSS